jgi:hypothetical protein
MKKFTPYLFGVIGIAIGFIIGSVWILRMHTFVSWHQWSGSTSVKANLIVATLKSIRSGDTNKAIERLEDQLDGEIIALGDIHTECPSPRYAATPIDALVRARDYRDAYPRKADFEFVNQSVAKAFALTTQTNK